MLRRDRGLVTVLSDIESPSDTLRRNLPSPGLAAHRAPLGVSPGHLVQVGCEGLTRNSLEGCGSPHLQSKEIPAEASSKSQG